ncbi:hydrogenase nickel incorporation protein HypB [Acetobacter peroxydans]|uniref:hydrogenase nickel incorporation protein HypB n=1 Tax=Acetobacter peroxydans TaxID=104098 RepID=UPI00235368A9|nr:hydrogenase nickel incorporation protein HypB [Acetobacter peroxydans]MCH4144186.1 hydrogenase nickel incorporation protein HypB [Acetobacter peroxydans]MCI1395161.1 hydrogenase nickel incorporation protein HypB [Acetobacter peroxydans]MCI1412282.1 hydrogenase nickel incorporation protein HypB [Acetobacter peroxydans]MCI1439685.1 hydrogenase nickel incorporation protein HypB [Acetobacter peroxydans]MCI1567592.1 hydrogenase nickel incorporation protein HypB [Acetobacter peroxydans]
MDPGHHHDHSHEHGHHHGHEHGEHAHDHTHEHHHGHAPHGAGAAVHADNGPAHTHGPDHHDYGTGPARSHAPGLTQARMVEIERNILSKNDAYADQNRETLSRRGVLALNLLAGPGAGKTTLLVETLKLLHGAIPAAVIEGDQQTSNDAERIRATGVRAVQINTGKGCHLDAHQVGHALEHLPLPPGGVLFVENVGNLVCPAAFDLGEQLRVTLLSVTEGEDKPLKYPDIFQNADLVILTKTDLVPYLGTDMELLEANVRRVAPKARILHTGARTGAGMDTWLDWLKTERSTWLADLAAQAEARAATLRAAG